MKLYYDLNVPIISNKKLIMQYMELGYNRLALNTIIDLSEFNFEAMDKNPKSKKKKSKLRSKLLMQLKQPNLQELLKYLLTVNKSIKIFTRITLQSKDVLLLQNFTQKYQNLLNDFDIIACECQSEEVLSYASEEMTVDILCFDFQVWVPYFSKSVVGKCRQREVMIEVNMSSAIASVIDKVHIVKMIDTLNSFHATDIIIVTSGSSNFWFIRGILGLCCLICAMGLPESSVPHLTSNCDKVVEHGRVRKYTVQGRAALSKLSKLPGLKFITINRPTTQQNPSLEVTKVLQEEPKSLSDNQDSVCDEKESDVEVQEANILSPKRKKQKLH